MLLLLEVKNMALIENVSFRPGPGLNVITGETGAGKSLLLGALQLLLGTRADPGLIRSGEEFASIEAVFNNTAQLKLEEKLCFSPGEELVLSREIRHGGVNPCRINSRIYPLSSIVTLSRQLVDLLGQNQQQSLLNAGTQLELLDIFGCLKDKIERVTALNDKRKELVTVLTGLGGDSAARERQLDFLRFQLEEIDAAGLNQEEESCLEKSFLRLTHAKELFAQTGSIYDELYEGTAAISVTEHLGGIEKELSAAAVLDDSLEGVLGQIAEAINQLTEAARELRSYRDEIIFDEQKLQETADRLDIYKKIKKKYGPYVTDVHKLRGELARQIASLENQDELAADTAIELDNVKEQLFVAAQDLTVERKRAAKNLSERINKVLSLLALPEARFEIDIKSDRDIGRHGQDKVNFMFSANEGVGLHPLGKVASGGEVARVMLAIKSVLAEEDKVPTLVFDEIDAGIGGETVAAVAQRLRLLARHHQVICVTHQSLIAAAADHHFAICKEKEGGSIITRLRHLSLAEREQELSRMLGGEAGGDTALHHARQLLKKF